jgi:hypothetical protein
MWATWPPGTLVRVGDLGTLDGYAFRPLGSLEALAAEFDVQHDATATDLTFTSNVQTLRRPGEIEYRFDSDGVVFEARGCVRDSLVDPASVARALPTAPETTLLPAEYVLVT